MTQISSTFPGLSSKSSFPKKLRSASKASPFTSDPKSRADIIYQNPNNFPKGLGAKNSPFQETASFLKSKSIDDFIKNSGKKTIPLADLPLADLPYYNHRANEDALSDDLEGLSHADENSSDADRFSKTTPNAKGKHSPGSFHDKTLTREAKTQSRYHQDLGSTAFKTPTSKELFKDSKENAQGLFSAPNKPNKITEQRKLDLDDHEDNMSEEIEDETQGDEELDQVESRNMYIGPVSDRKDSAKRYNVFEDWRIMESVDFYIKENGTRGILSKAVWEKLVDPKTGSKVLSGRRSNESMRERYKKWLRKMTPEDRQEMSHFVKNHPEEHIKRYNCSFGQNVNSEKKTTRPDLEAASEVSQDDTRSENFLNSPRVENSERDKNSAVKTPKFDNLTNSAVSFEKSRTPNRYFEEEDDDCGIRDFEQLEPAVIERHQTTKTKSRKPISPVKKNFSSKQTNLQVQDVSGKKRLLNINLYEEKFNDQENNDVHHTKKIKADVMGKSTKQVVRTIQKAAPPKTMEVEEEQVCEIIEEPQKVDELGSELQEMIKNRNPKKLEDMNLDIMIVVDDTKGQRHFMQKQKEVKSQPQHKLVQLSKTYNIELKNLLEAFYSLSNDYDDLENYLKSGDDRYVWTLVDDQGLLENDPTALHYLKLLKGEERIEKRRMFLLREAN